MREEHPSVSVCTIAFNHAHCIQDCIKGVQNQSYAGQIQHVIADDCSTDSTWERIRAATKIQNRVHYRLIRNPENQGPEKNFIEAVQACQGDFIALCEGDDFWIEETKLERQIRILEKYPEAAMTTHECYKIHFPPGKFRSYKRVVKMIFWDTLTYGLRGTFDLARAAFAGPDLFWAKERAHLEGRRKMLYSLEDYSNRRWIQPFCSILMRRDVADALVSVLQESKGGHQAALLLGCIFGGIRHIRTPMAVKRDQQSSITLNELLKSENRQRDRDPTKNNERKRYEALMKYATADQRCVLKKMINDSLAQISGKMEKN